MINTFLIAGIIVECIVLALLALLGKLSGKAFAVIAFVTAICCAAVGFIDAGTHKVQEKTDIRSSIYMAARLIEEEHEPESLELISEVSDKEGEQYGSRSLRALSYNLNGAFIAAELTLQGDGISEQEQELLNQSEYRSTVGEELKTSIIQNVFTLVAATDTEIAGWETEMKVRFMGLKLTEEEKQATGDKLTLVKDALRDYRNEEAFRIMSENPAGVQDAIIVSEMYAKGYSNLIMANTDEEYAQLWKEVTELQAEVNVASLSQNTEEVYRPMEEGEETDPAAEEYEKLNARYRIAQESLHDETVKRSINYLNAYADQEGDDTAGYQLQLAQLYFDIREQDKARECLDKVFFGEPMTNDQWLGGDVEAFKKAFIIYLSDGTDKEYNVLFDNIMNSLYQGLFEYGGNSSFKTFVLEYLNEKMSGMAIRHVSTDEFPQVTADISVSDKDYVLTKENLSVTDSGTEITDFTLEQIEVSDLSLVFVLDKSGSMSGDRIEKSKEAIKSCISQLESGAQMGLVSFESDSTLECGLTDSGTIVSGSVDGIEASGGTNISAGLATGVELLAGRSGTKVIILLSDGQGSGSNLSEVVSEAAAQGIVIYTIGLPGCDEETLQSIAANSGGQFIMVEDTAMLSATYDDIQSAVTNSYRLTYHVEGDKENRKITVVDAGSGHEAARYYSTVKPEPEVPADEPEDTNDTQVADFYRQIGGSEGGR